MSAGDSSVVVYFDDRSWTTVLVGFSTTAADVCHMICSKRHLVLSAADWFSLSVVHGFDTAQQRPSVPSPAAQSIEEEEEDEDEDDDSDDDGAVPPPPPPESPPPPLSPASGHTVERILDPEETIATMPELQTTVARSRQSRTASAADPEADMDERWCRDPVSQQLAVAKLTLVFRSSALERNPSIKLPVKRAGSMRLPKSQPSPLLSPRHRSQVAAGLEPLKGWLLKRGQHNTAWRKRWFSLQGTELFYYKDPSTQRALGSIDLSRARVRRFPEDTLADAVRHESFDALAAWISRTDGEQDILQRVLRRRSHRRRQRRAISLHDNLEGGGAQLTAEAAKVGNGGFETGYRFDVVTPKRVFRLQCFARKELEAWMRELAYVTDEAEEDDPLDGLDDVLCGLELAKSDAEEAISAQIETLDGIFARPKALKHFCAWAVLNHCEENLNFWFDVQQLKVLVGSERRESAPPFAKLPSSFSPVMPATIEGLGADERANAASLAEKIYDEYVRAGAPHELMIGRKTREEVSQALHQATEPHMYAAAFAPVERLIHSQVSLELLPKFLESHQCRKLMLDLPIPVGFVDGTPLERYDGSYYDGIGIDRRLSEDDDDDEHDMKVEELPEEGEDGKDDNNNDNYMQVVGGPGVPSERRRSTAISVLHSLQRPYELVGASGGGGGGGAVTAGVEGGDSDDDGDEEEDDYVPHTLHRLLTLEQTLEGAGVRPSLAVKPFARADLRGYDDVLASRGLARVSTSTDVELTQRRRRLSLRNHQYRSRHQRSGSDPDVMPLAAKNDATTTADAPPPPPSPPPPPPPAQQRQSEQLGPVLAVPGSVSSSSESSDDEDGGVAPPPPPPPPPSSTPPPPPAPGQKTGQASPTTTAPPPPPPPSAPVRVPLRRDPSSMNLLNSSVMSRIQKRADPLRQSSLNKGAAGHDIQAFRTRRTPSVNNRRALHEHHHSQQQQQEQRRQQQQVQKRKVELKRGQARKTPSFLMANGRQARWTRVSGCGPSVWERARAYSRAVHEQKAKSKPWERRQP